MSDEPRNPINENHLTISLLKHVADVIIEKGATFIVVAGYDLRHLESYSETEQWLKTVRFNEEGVGERIAWLKSVPEHFDALYGDLAQYSKEYIENIFTPLPNINTRRGRANKNFKSTYVNVYNGCRFTVGQPEVYEHSILMIGSSSLYGFGCEDKHTIPSLLQELINSSESIEKKYSVFNLGARGNPKFVDFYKILHLNVCSGDIVVMHGINEAIVKELSPLESDHLFFISPDYSQRFRIGEIFFDAGHVNFKGHGIVARQIYECIAQIHRYSGNDISEPDHITLLGEDERVQALNELDQFTTIYTHLKSNIEAYPDIRNFINRLKPFCNMEGISGAVVVNCNPFTLGHRYLIEYAAKKVDNLYVFVVEEDLSYFDFKTRFSMVLDGVKGLSNVRIFPSGRYMMSTVTCPEYFSKEEEREADLDASKDMDIFGEYIAPVLNISVRFVGEEPNCHITKQHNNQMRNILPTYGVHVEEVKRIAIDGQIVSASVVRNYLKRSEIDKVVGLVPPSTLGYITNMKQTLNSA